MDHPLRLERVELAVRPWRTATVAVALVAAVELVLLLVIGGALAREARPVRSRRAGEDDEGRRRDPGAEGGQGDARDAPKSHRSTFRVAT